MSHPWAGAGVKEPPPSNRPGSVEARPSEGFRQHARLRCPRYADIMSGLLSRDDVLQSMQLALAESARAFDAERAVPCLSFAWRNITGAVVRAATKEIEAPSPTFPPTTSS
jgi:hypothetical protein